MKLLLKRDPNVLILSLILILAIILRFYGLTNQSLWVDELHTMNEADPDIPWSMLFDYLLCCDQHPPLFFFIERFLFTLFGHTEFVARSLSALCGVLSVWGMYLLGKELLNKQLGLTSALLTCINYYNIIYSQEARGYIMAFLFTVLSYVYFIKLIKRLERKNIYWYALTTLGLLYSHYFSLFIVASQAVVALIIFLNEKDKKAFFKSLGLSAIIIFLGYLPWIPFFIKMSKLKSFWIGPIEQDFVFGYFSDYFGNFALLEPFLVLLIIHYCLQIFLHKNETLEEIKHSPLALSFLVFFLAMAFTYFIPYLRSVLVVPMLYNRYTIVVVPVFLIAIAFSIVLIKNNLVRNIIFSTVVILSLSDILIIKKYYSRRRINKTQFRELTQFISENKETLYTIVNELTAWQHAYYLKRFNYNVPVLTGTKEVTIDSILHKTSAKYDLEGFWIIGTHGVSHLDSSTRAKLDTAYMLVKERDFYDAWGQLYVRRTSSMVMLIPDYFTGQIVNINEQDVVPVWGGSITSQPIQMKPGKYYITVLHRGTKAARVYPHLNLYINDRKIGDFYTSEFFTDYEFPLELLQDESITVRIELDNDYQDPGTKEDRNAFIKHILVRPQ